VSHRLQVLIPEDLDARIGKAAQRARVSKGEWVRRAVEAALRESQQERGRPTDPLARLASLQGPTGDIDQMLEEIDAGRR
jgi:metal-responsive CopG/Arc/MetJ family transcriptional regulator